MTMSLVCTSTNTISKQEHMATPSLHDQPFIDTTKHGYKSVSLSRHGLNLIREISRGQANVRSDLIQKIRCLFRWVKRQLTHYQYLKIVG
jgi:hypothetical protein